MKINILYVVHLLSVALFMCPCSVAEDLTNEELMHKGIYLMRRSRFEQAFNCFDEILVKNPGDERALLYKGTCHLEFGEYGDALSYLNNVIDKNPGSAQALYRKGLCYYRLGQYNNALVYFGETIIHDPALVDAWYGRGRCYEFINRYDEALKCYDEILIKRNVKFMEAWLCKCLCLEKLGRLEEAEECYSKVKKFENLSSTTFYNTDMKSDYIPWNDMGYKEWYNKGNDLLSEGYYERAIDFYLRALEINPVDTDTWNNMGVCHAQCSRYRDAVRCYGKIIERDKIINTDKTKIKHTDHKFLNNYASCLLKLGRYDESVKYLTIFIGYYPKSASAWCNKGIALGHLDQHLAALVCYDKALEISPEDTLILRNKGVALMKLGNYTIALNVFKKALSIKPDDADLAECVNTCRKNLEATR